MYICMYVYIIGEEFELQILNSVKWLGMDTFKGNCAVNAYKI